MIRTKTAAVFYVIFFICLFSFSVAHARDDEWFESVSGYTEEIEKIIQGEPEQQMRMIKAVFEANKAGDKEKVDVLVDDLKNMISA